MKVTDCGMAHSCQGPAAPIYGFAVAESGRSWLFEKEN